jgi:hypothetical protein
MSDTTNRKSRVYSFDPGTQNLGLAVLDFDADIEGSVRTVESFLRCIRLHRLEFANLGTNHINTATARFKSLCSATDGGWEFVCKEYRGDEFEDVVIEQQGSVASPIIHLCHAIHGFFLGLQASHGDGRSGSVYVDYSAAAKFRGDWIYVEKNPQRPLSPSLTASLTTRDPVKRAAVELVERLVSYFVETPALTESIKQVNKESRQHDMADAILQGVSFLFRRHVQRLGTTRADPKKTLSLETPEERRSNVTEHTLKLPRDSRGSLGGRTRTTTVRASRPAKKRGRIAEDLPNVSFEDLD